MHPTLHALSYGQPQAALGTLGPDGPHVSMVLVVPDQPDTALPFGSWIMHLSNLSPHTRYLNNAPQVGLLLAQIDPTAADPQALPRLSVQGSVTLVPPDATVYATYRARYLARFPHAEQLFALAGFALYRFTPQHARYIGGYGQAYRLSAEQLGMLQLPAERERG